MLPVEDNPVNQEVGVAILNSLGCAVAVADDGRAAVAAVLGSHYDVVLMDCQMPEMDGFAATAAIRAQEAQRNTQARLAGLPIRDTPIIALTANAMEGDRDRCLAAGMDDYLTKPFRSEQIRAVLEQWVQRASTPASDPMPTGSHATTPTLHVVRQEPAEAAQAAVADRADLPRELRAAS